MSTKQFAMELLEAVQEMRARGRKTVRLERLEQLLQQTADEPDTLSSPTVVERFKAELQQWNDDQQRNHEIILENFRAVITAGQNAVRTILLINGGAAIAMLAYLGNLAARTSVNLAPFALAMAPFTAGVLTAGLMSGGTYLTQWFYGQDKVWQIWVGHILNWLVILLGVAAYGFFGLGMWLTYVALTS